VSRSLGAKEVEDDSSHLELGSQLTLLLGSSEKRGCLPHVCVCQSQIPSVDDLGTVRAPCWECSEALPQCSAVGCAAGPPTPLEGGFAGLRFCCRRLQKWLSGCFWIWRSTQLISTGQLPELAVKKWFEMCSWQIFKLKMNLVIRAK